MVARGFLIGPSKKCILQCASVGFFSSILFNGTLRKRYKSCHWGSTLSKVINMYILDTNMHTLGTNMYL